MSRRTSHRASVDHSSTNSSTRSFLNPDSGSTRRASSSTILFEHRNLGHSTEAITAKMSSSSVNSSPFKVVEKGRLNTLDYRIFLEGPNGLISPWHDIPLYADEANKVFNMVVEIPRWSNAKMEMATKEVASPIKQDEKGGKPRFVHNIFPFHGYIWNYGALPQTWEDPNHKDEHTGALGDNDPIDVVEIGSKVHHRGAVVQVKVIGVLALLDDGETDWKLVTIEINDPLASQVNSLTDVEEHFPGLLNATREWFRIYKIPAGKKPNAFGFDGEYKDKDFAHKVIEQTHQFWLDLVKQASPPLNTESHHEGAAHPAHQAKWSEVVDSLPALGSAADEPEDLQKWHFVKGSALASSPK